MPTDVEICNGALQKIGAKTISALSELSDEGKICNQEFGKTHKLVLRLLAPQHAIQRVLLTSPAVTPAFEFTYGHNLPSNFCRLLELYNYDGAHKIEGGVLLCDSDEVSLKYIADDVAVTAGDELFVETLEWRLAFNISKTLSESDSIRKIAWDGYQQAISMAKFIQSTENSQLQMEANDLIDARIGYGGFVRDPGT